MGEKNMKLFANGQLNSGVLNTRRKTMEPSWIPMYDALFWNQVR